MKTSEVDILIVPGWSSSGPGHWQSRWEKSLKTATRIEQADWFKPSKSDWIKSIAEAVEAASKPVVLVAHSLGVISVVHAAGQLPRGKVTGAFLVAPADVENAGDWPVTKGQRFSEHGPDFAPIPHGPLPFPSVLIASTSDPYCSLMRAQELALDWGSMLVEAGDAGHINLDSGHGPWPEGLMRLGWFLKQLGPAGDG